MLIYLCLSSHGYGHASRQATIFRELHRIKPSWRLIVSSLVDEDFLISAFRGIPIEFRKVLWDIGTVQSDALGFDSSSTLLELQKLENSLPQLINVESNWIRQQAQPTLILGDIPPSAAELASKVSAPLIWIGNFGWDNIYKSLGRQFLYFSKQAAKEYSRGNMLINLPFSLDINWGIPSMKVSITSSKPVDLPRNLVEKISSFDGEKIIFAFGGFGYKIDLSLFSKWPQNLFFMYQDVNNPLHDKRPENLIYIPKSIRTLDLMPYCSRLITKPGYSSFCEALSNDVGIHVVKRDNFAEADLLIKQLKLNGHYRIIDRDALRNGFWELDQPLLPPAQVPLPIDGSSTAARIIIDFIERYP